MDLVAFDFAGCGNSEGDFITLGHRERDDLTAVIGWLKEKGNTSSVGLWGRSMGGATALMFDTEASPLPVGCLVIDSAFARFDEIAKGLAGQMGIPDQFFQMMFVGVSNNVEKLTGMNPMTLAPVNSAKNGKVPALFIHGIEDELIPMDHSERNYEAYAHATKDVCYVEGSHNTERPPETEK